MKITGAVAALSLILGTAGRANASVIVYDYTTTLSLLSGPDALGLAGATVTIQADVNSNAVYGLIGVLPAVQMNSDATVTISGSTIAANNGVFSLGQTSFAPTYAGLYTGIGDFLALTLPVGGTINEMILRTNPTAVGATEVAGDTVNVLDFAPATEPTVDWQDAGSNSEYAQNNIVITAILTPEPATLGLALAGFCGLALMRRLRTR